MIFPVGFATIPSVSCEAVFGRAQLEKCFAKLAPLLGADARQHNAVGVM